MAEAVKSEPKGHALSAAAARLADKAASKAETLENNHPWDGKTRLDGATQPEWREREKGLAHFADRVAAGENVTPKQAAAEADIKANALDQIATLRKDAAPPSMDGAQAWAWRERSIALNHLSQTLGPDKTKAIQMPEKATLKPEEKQARNRAETGAWAGMQERGAVLRREAMATQAAERKEAGLPAEEPKQEKGLSQ